MTCVLVVAYVAQALLMTIAYNGGQGDDRYQLAYFESVAQGDVFGDYYYRDVPTHYPPLVFWIGGAFQALVGLDSITAWRWLAPLYLAATAAILAWAARLGRGSQALTLVLAFGLGSFSVSYLADFPPSRGVWATQLLKPQQVLAGALALVLALLATREGTVGDGGASRIRTAGAAALVSAGIVLTHPTYLAFALAGVAAGSWWLRRDGRRGRTLPILTGVVAGLALSSIYTLPPLLNWLRGNWESAYLSWQSVDSLDPTRWTVGFAFGVPLVAGLLSLRKYRDAPSVALSAVAAAAAALYFSSFVTYPVWGISLLSWWAPIPAMLAMCVLGGRLLADWIGDKRRIALGVTLAITIASWNIYTDAQLKRSHDRILGDLSAAGEVLERLPAEATFIGGTDTLLLPAMTGRKYTLVPHAFYANPMAENAARLADVEALLSDPSCERGEAMRTHWGTYAIVSTDDVITLLEPRKGRDPRNAGINRILPLPREMPACWERAFSGEVLEVWVFDPTQGGREPGRS